MRVESLADDMLSYAPFIPRNRRFDELEVSVEGGIYARPYGDRYEIFYGFQEADRQRALGSSSLNVRLFYLTDEEAVSIGLWLCLNHGKAHLLDSIEYYNLIMERFGWKRSYLARVLGIDRSTLTNRLQLLNLSDDVSIMLKMPNVSLSIEHAKILCRQSKCVQSEFASKTVKLNWTTRQLSAALSKGVEQPERGEEGGWNSSQLEEGLSDKLCYPATINLDQSQDYNGSLKLGFNSIKELAGIAAALYKLAEKNEDFKGEVELKISNLEHFNSVFSQIGPEA